MLSQDWTIVSNQLYFIFTLRYITMKIWVCLASTLAFMAIFGSARKIAENPVVSYEGYKVFR